MSLSFHSIFPFISIRLHLTLEHWERGNILRERKPMWGRRAMIHMFWNALTTRNRFLQCQYHSWQAREDKRRRAGLCHHGVKTANIHSTTQRISRAWKVGNVAKKIFTADFILNVLLYASFSFTFFLFTSVEWAWKMNSWKKMNSLTFIALLFIKGTRAFGHALAFHKSKRASWWEAAKANIVGGWHVSKLEDNE